jgi:hypothetical protein
MPLVETVCKCSSQWTVGCMERAQNLADNQSLPCWHYCITLHSLNCFIDFLTAYLIVLRIDISSEFPLRGIPSLTANSRIGSAISLVRVYFPFTCVVKEAQSTTGCTSYQSIFKYMVHMGKNMRSFINNLLPNSSSLIQRVMKDSNILDHTILCVFWLCHI